MATYNVLIPEKYIGADKVERTSYFNIGVAFDTKDGEGLSVRLAPGVTVSGQILILPRKDRDGSQHAAPAASETDEEIPF